MAKKTPTTTPQRAKENPPGNDKPGARQPEAEPPIVEEAVQRSHGGSRPVAAKAVAAAKSAAGDAILPSDEPQKTLAERGAGEPGAEPAQPAKGQAKPRPAGKPPVPETLSPQASASGSEPVTAAPGSRPASANPKPEVVPPEKAESAAAAKSAAGDAILPSDEPQKELAEREAGKPEAEPAQPAKGQAKPRPAGKPPVPETAPAATAGSESKPVKAKPGSNAAGANAKPEVVAPELAGEAELVASLPPLPSEEPHDEAGKMELLRAVEEQYNALAKDGAFTPEAEGRPVADQVLAPHAEPTPEHHSAAYTIPSLFIVQISPELAPVAKVGGLADVVFGLSNELEMRGNHVEIILPKYDCMRYDHIWGLCETYKDLWVPWYGGAIHCTVYFGFVHGRKCFFIEPHSADNFFNRGSVYGFNDDVMRFAFFSRAAMEFLWKSGKHPDIIHCHDWQTALVPVFLFEIYQHMGMRHPRACLTIHNFKHQGVTGAQLLQATGLNRPEYYLHYDRLRDNQNPHALNLMKAGVVYSNFVTTVSPRHAMEAKDQGQGFGLEATLHVHHVKYGGVVNGIDYAVWNPEIDPYIPFHYSVDRIDEKYNNKRALRHRLMLADNEKPIVAFVGRLDPQKGLELIRHAIFNTLHRGGQFVLLGSSPDSQINNHFWGLKQQFNNNPDCHIEVGFNEELSHLIYAGADIMVVPSRFEPCGLTQLIAMRYGTIPVVREIGGLADTVFDKDYSWKSLHERTGYMFRDYNEAGLESALGRAISCYYQFPEHFRELIKNAMRYDSSWKNPGQDYLNIYDYIREK